MKRTQARELAFKTIYSKFFNQEQTELSETDLLEDVDQLSLEFINSILKNFASHYDEINEIISKNLTGYTINRVNKIDLALIIEAVIEVKYLETPLKVVLNEVVELAKKYSTEKSPKFVNGVLADIFKEQKN